MVKGGVPRTVKYVEKQRRRAATKTRMTRLVPKREHDRISQLVFQLMPTEVIDLIYQYMSCTSRVSFAHTCSMFMGIAKGFDYLIRIPLFRPEMLRCHTCAPSAISFVTDSQMCDVLACHFAKTCALCARCARDCICQTTTCLVRFCDTVKTCVLCTRCSAHCRCKKRICWDWKMKQTGGCKRVTRCCSACFECVSHCRCMYVLCRGGCRSMTKVGDRYKGQYPLCTDCR